MNRRGNTVMIMIISMVTCYLLIGIWFAITNATPAYDPFGQVQYCVDGRFHEFSATLSEVALWFLQNQPANFVYPNIFAPSCEVDP